jgi:hypothetical protein
VFSDETPDKQFQGSEVTDRPIESNTNWVQRVGLLVHTTNAFKGEPHNQTNDTKQDMTRSQPKPIRNDRNVSPLFIANAQNLTKRRPFFKF